MCVGSPIHSAALGKPIESKPEVQPGPASPPDMVNNQIIENANDRAGQEKARNEFDPKLKSQSSKY
tara:strand:+ start:348 stop:545 length:198 start_codon:yes stop_codon:yes gene_type:complete